MTSKWIQSCTLPDRLSTPIGRNIADDGANLAAIRLFTQDLKVEDEISARARSLNAQAQAVRQTSLFSPLPSFG